MAILPHESSLSASSSSASLRAHAPGAATPTGSDKEILSKLVDLVLDVQFRMNALESSLATVNAKANKLKDRANVFEDGIRNTMAQFKDNFEPHEENTKDFSKRLNVIAEKQRMHQQEMVSTNEQNMQDLTKRLEMLEKKQGITATVTKVACEMTLKQQETDRKSVV